MKPASEDRGPDASARAVSARIRAVLEERLGPGRFELRLFGSRARGRGHGESDIDVLLIVPDDVDRARVHDMLDDPLFDVLVEREELVAVLVLHRSEFERLDTPLLRQLRATAVPA